MKTQALTIATLLLLLIGTFRGVAMLVSDPLIAQANNYDMIRVQACISAYPDRPADIPVWSNSPKAPLERYRFIVPTVGSCFMTSEVLFSYMALPLMRFEASRSEDRSFSIRWVGLVKLSTLLVLMWGFSITWLRKKNFPAAFINAVIGAAVIMDPANTIYLNGFYAELSSLIFAYAALGGLVMAVDSPRWNMASMIVGLGIIGLTLSKVQHAGAGLSLAIGLTVLMLFGQRIPKQIFITVVLTAIIGFGVQIAHMKQEDTQIMRLVNITTVVFTTIMPLSDDDERLTEHLGLPRHCSQYSGLSWFRAPINENLDNHPCREAVEISYIKLLTLLIDQPLTMWRFVSGGWDHLRPWLGNRKHDGRIYLGLVEGEEFADLPANWFTLSRFLDRLGPLPYVLFLILPLASLPVILYLVGRSILDFSVSGVLLLLVFLASSTYVSILLGNGYMDTAKLANLMTNLLVSFWIVAIMVGIAGLARRVRQ